LKEKLFEGIPINPVKRIVIDENLLNEIPEILQSIGIVNNVTIICDENTYEAAGKMVISCLKDETLDVSICEFHGKDHLIPDERALGEILIKMNAESEFLIAIGSGTINDLTRFVSFKTGIPYGIIATAPSMDGYTSSVSPLIVNGFKRTYNAVYPQFVIGDLNVLSRAPYDMITSGFGDIIGKYTSLADWMISSVVNEESYSNEIADIVKNSVERCVESAERMKSRDRKVIKNVMDALVLSGIAMLKVGNSRPASGAEHHIAHYIEIKDLMAGKRPPFHGTSVGVAETIVTDIYHKVFSLNVDDVRKSISKRRFESAFEHKKRIEKIYGPISKEIFEETGDFYLDELERKKRQESILSNWENLKRWVKQNVPESDRIKDLLRTIGAPTSLKEIGVDADVFEIIENAKEIRKRYTIFRLMEDIGLDPYEFINIGAVKY
jgi:glycerol-1-phosphate dehydrogenase [NAD(P)+]